MTVGENMKIKGSFSIAFTGFLFSIFISIPLHGHENVTQGVKPAEIEIAEGKISTPNPIQPWVALIGVIVGFVLGEGSPLARNYWQIHRDKQLVKAELEAILAQLPLKKDILNKALISMKGERLLPMVSVRTLAIGYQSVLEKLYPQLCDLERHCLHVIYERLRITDQCRVARGNFTPRPSQIRT